MSRYKVLALIALITLAFGVALAGDALAGEKVKARVASYLVKFENVAVGDEEGHILATYEAKGICTNLQGKKFLDGWPYRESGLNDIKGKAFDAYSVQGYGELTDRDGDKIYIAWKGTKLANEPGRGTQTMIKGTGKWQGIQGKGTWVVSDVMDMRYYSDWEWDVEWPK